MMLAMVGLTWIVSAAEEPVVRVTFDGDAPGPYVDAAAKAEWPGLKWFALQDRGKIVASEGEPAQRYYRDGIPAGQVRAGGERRAVPGAVAPAGRVLARLLRDVPRRLRLPPRRGSSPGSAATGR
ncbi:MAG: hypothetical protein M5U09_22150 [Gammaproteobacteria bacterium]|nr:hypothetical protein [Gammaproteobacteria bacterium]